MRHASFAFVALPALLAAALLPTGTAQAPAPREPSAAQIDAAVRYAQREAGLDAAGLRRR